MVQKGWESGSFFAQRDLWRDILIDWDKGYYQKSVYQAVRNKNQDAFVTIHPRSNPVISDNKKWT